MAREWTDEQRAAIDFCSGNLLVSAAAGSGKTAVLVEHVKRMIIDENNPIDVDRMLIVTFTRAAAAQMKERLEAALEAALTEDPANGRLARQSALIRNAHIQTIDAFCSWVVKTYAQHTAALGMDPDFRIGDTGELELIRAEVMEDLLEGYYERADQWFVDLLDAFGGDRTDESFSSLVLTLYDRAQSLPDPERWLDICAGYGGSDTSFLDDIVTNAKSVLSDCIGILQGGLKKASAVQDLSKYVEMFQSDMDCLRHIAQYATYPEMNDAFANLSFSRAPVIRNCREAALKEELKAARDFIKQTVKKLKDDFFFAPPKELSMVEEKSGVLLGRLSYLAKEFGRRFADTKKERNVAEFSDVSHWALQMLECGDGPSELGLTIGRKFDFIAIDEYQDSNMLQERILTAVSGVHRGEPNTFMVGDVKQSIYRFRMAKPELFMEKYAAYPKEGGQDGRLIILGKNFRTRAHILKSINSVFFRIMGKTLGGIDYDDENALYPGAAYPDDTHDVELVLVDAGHASGRARVEAEAAAIASRINELTDPVSGLMLWEPEKNKWRRAGYSDIAILMRSMKDYSEIYEDVLKAYGVPVSVIQDRGYFSANEVCVTLNALKILDNPDQDIPLASVMLSPMGGFTKDSLAKIAACAKSLQDDGNAGGGLARGLYNSLKLCAQALGQAGGLPERGGILDAATISKIRKFISFIERMRDFAEHNSVYALINEIFKETSYDIYVTALPDGALRIANIRMLKEKAAAFERTGFKGLFQFNRYIEKIRGHGIDYGEASTVSENQDAVRLLTIHKSKGLEFPIVFVCGLQKQFNKSDTKKDVVFHDKWGAAANYIDYDNCIRHKGLKKKFIDACILEESLGEELRVLYVAMTRAKEKLILTACMDTPEEKYVSLMNGTSMFKGRIPGWAVAGAGSFLEFLAMAESGGEIFKRSVVTPQVIEKAGQKRAVAQKGFRQKLEEAAMVYMWHGPVKEAAKEFSGAISFKYPYAADCGIKSIYSVSELKREALNGAAGNMPHGGTPIRGRADGVAAGNAYHKVLSLMPPGIGGDAEAIRVWMRDGLSKQEASLVDAADIAAFYATDFGKRVILAHSAGKRYAERPFVIGVPAKEIQKGVQSDGLVMVQGVIDLYIVEDDGIALVDYKTDRADEKELVLRYGMQLEMYKRALEQITGVKVKESLIYSFYNRTFIGT